jgi:hypothetical protein
MFAERVRKRLCVRSQRVVSDFDPEAVRVGDEVVEPSRIGVGAGRRGEHVDPVSLVFVGEVHHGVCALEFRLRSGGGEE